MTKESRVIRLDLDCIEKLELLSELTSSSTRKIAERLIVWSFKQLMKDEKFAKEILELKAKLRVRQQILEMEMDLVDKDGKIVRVEENGC